MTTKKTKQDRHDTFIIDVIALTEEEALEYSKGLHPFKKQDKYASIYKALLDKAKENNGAGGWKRIRIRRKTLIEAKEAYRRMQISLNKWFNEKHSELFHSIEANDEEVPNEVSLYVFVSEHGRQNCKEDEILSTESPD